MYIYMPVEEKWDFLLALLLDVLAPNCSLVRLKSIGRWGTLEPRGHTPGFL